MPLKTAILFLFISAALGRAVEIRVAAFNIGAHFTTSSTGVYYPDYSLGAPGTPDHDNVRDILRRINADVVSLEEIHSADISAGDVTALAGGLGYPYLFIAPATNTFDTSLHVAILSRYPFLTQSLITSPAGAKEMNRLIPAVKVDVPGTTRDPVIIGAHLKSGSAASDAFQRTVEMRRLTKYLSSQGLTANDNFLIAGDFNLSDNDRTFTAAPASGLPGTFSLGADITYPISYFTDPLGYYGTPAVKRIIPRQLDQSTVTFPSSGSTIDLFIVSPVIGSRPLHTEIYNSTLDLSNTGGLPKSGAPLSSGTSAAASDHYAIFGDIELDPAEPYAFNAPGETIGETFSGFTGTYDPYPWTTSGGTWQGKDNGTSTAVGFRSYGSDNDPSLGFLPGTTAAAATAAFVNHSSQVLRALRISFNPEQWRSTNGGTADRLSAELIVNGVATPLPALTFTASDNLTSGAVAGGTSAEKNMTVSGLSVAPGAAFQLKFIFTPGSGGGLLPADVFINEFSYVGTGEFIEVAVGPGFTGNLSDISILFYNGTNGTTYMGAQTLDTFTAGAVTSSGHRIFSKMIPSIQNGDPDGLALAVNGAVTRFISYGGSFAATTGLANGITSTDIGVKQASSDTAGQAALGLTGTGGGYSNFHWSKFTGIAHSPGQANSGQTFTTPLQPQGIAIDNLAVTFLSDSDGDGISDADEIVFGTDPQDAASKFVVTLSRPAADQLQLAFPTASGRNYAVESSTDLSSWTGIANYSGTGSPQNAPLTVSSEDSQRFYRIRVTLQ